MPPQRRCRFHHFNAVVSVALFVLALSPYRPISAATSDYASLGEGICAIDGDEVKYCWYTLPESLGVNCEQACSQALPVPKSRRLLQVDGDTDTNANANTNEDSHQTGGFERQLDEEGDSYSCLGWSGKYQESSSAYACFLYGFATTCPTIDGVAGTIGLFGSTDFDNINGVMISEALSSFECVLKKSYVEEHSLAFTSEGEYVTSQRMFGLHTSYSALPCTAPETLTAL